MKNIKPVKILCAFFLQTQRLAFEALLAFLFIFNNGFVARETEIYNCSLL